MSFDPFHLTDFKDKCIMLYLEGEKSNIEPLITCCFEDRVTGEVDTGKLIPAPRSPTSVWFSKTMPLIMTHPTSVSTTLFNRQSPRECSSFLLLGSQ